MTRQTSIIACVSLTVLLPLGLWGLSPSQGQLNTLVLFCLAIAVLTLPNPWLIGLASVPVIWLAWAYSNNFLGAYPPTGNIIEGSIILLMGLVAFHAVYNSTISTDIILDLIRISAIIQTTIAIFQYFWFDPMSWILSHVVTVMTAPDMARSPVGTIECPNYLAAYVAICLPLFLEKGYRLFIPAIILALFITKTATAFTAACIAVTCYWYGWRGVIFGIIGGALYFFLLRHYSIDSLLHGERAVLWTDAIKLNLKHWYRFLFGYGTGLRPWANNFFHSEYVATMFDFGLAGLSFMAAYIIDKFRKCDNRALISCFMALCVDMIGNHPLHIPATAILGVVIIALIERYPFATSSLTPSPRPPGYAATL